jgi:hypothetical protein
LEPTSVPEAVDLGDGVEVAVPPEDPEVPFFPTSVRDFLLTGNRVGELKIERLTPESDGLWRMEGRLVDARGVFPIPAPEDWISLRWTEDAIGLGVPQAVGRADPRTAEDSGRGDIRLTTEPVELAEKAVEKVQRMGGVELHDVTYRVFPKFGPRDDLFSLGMVYFLCILVNDFHDLGLIADEVELLRAEGELHGDWSVRARAQVENHPDTWGTNSVFFDAIDRSKDRPNSIPDDLWIDALALGLRLVFAANDLGVDKNDGVELFSRVEAEVEGILRRSRALLFDRQPLNMEIRQIVEELLAEYK